MKAIKLMIAAGLAIATTGAFAETGVKVTDVNQVANVYGRSTPANVAVKSDLKSVGADVATAGRMTPVSMGTEAVNTASEFKLYGRS